jgi:TonB-dependent receptor
VALRTNTDTEEELRNQILEAGGNDVLFDTVKIDYHGAYSEGTDKFPTAYGARFSTNPFPLAYNNQNNSANFMYRTLDGTNLLNQSIYTNGTNSDSPSSNRDREYSGAVNVSIPLQILSPDDQFKFGAIIRLRDRIVQNSNSPTINLPGTLADYTSGPSIDFYNGQYNIGPSINAGSVNRFVTKQGTGYDPTQFQRDVENVYAGYAQYGGSYGKLSWLGGVRLESTFGVYEQAPGQPGDVAFKHDYTSYFPSLQLKYDVTPTMDVRAVYSTAIGRPGFQEISPGASFNPGGPSVTIGNPNLSPEYADAFDLFWEYYLPRGGKVSIGGFDKEFNTFIFQNTLNAVYGSAALPVSVGSALGIPSTFIGTIVPITTYQNSGPSRVYGIEGEYTQQFLFLHAPWDGFGIDSNLTYNQSSATIIRNGVAETLQQPQTSPWNFNAALFYEKDPITFRFAANYVSKDLYSLGGSKQTDVYVQQRFRLDLGTAYQVTKHIQLYFDAHNLTDQALKYTETASVSRPIQREFYGIDVQGGIRVTY